MVDLRVAHGVRLPTALLSLKERKKLAPPLRGGAEEAPVARVCCGREGVLVLVLPLLLFSLLLLLI